MQDQIRGARRSFDIEHETVGILSNPIEVSRVIIRKVLHRLVILFAMPLVYQVDRLLARIGELHIPAMASLIRPSTKRSFSPSRRRGGGMSII